ncbi:ATP-binding protein [Gaopeijia maritima]|uniref:hybrid sensor histidine kinase/response regulator n=1 Tax=Gaopeijia maritima TaxID=3119007 RepID=UPI0032479870
MTTVDLSLAFVTGHPRAMALLGADGRVVVHSRGWIRQEGPIPDLVGTPAPRGEALLGALERSSHPDAARVDRMVREVLSGGVQSLQAEIRARLGEHTRCVVVLTALRLEGEPAACIEFLPPTPPRVDADARAEAPFREVVETLESVVFVTTPALAGGHRLVQYVSPAWDKVWGRPRSLLRDEPRSFLESIHPDDREEVAAALAREAQGNWDREFRIVRPDGTVRWIHSRAFAVRNEQGDVDRIVTLATDVTPRRKVTDALRRSRDELDQIVDRAPVALILHQRGQVLKANRVAADYLDEDHPASVTRVALMERIHPEDRALADPPEGSGPRPADRIIRIRSKAGDWVGYRAASVRIEGAGGQPVGLLALWGPHRAPVGVASLRPDATAGGDDRLFDAAPLGMAILTPEGGLRRANSRLVAMLGWHEAPPPADLIGALVADDDQVRVRAALRGLATGQVGAVGGELDLLHGGGHRVPLALHLARIDDGGVLVVAEDLSARRATEDRRRHAERIEALGRLAGGIAHDFNNLMTVVTGHAELVLEELPRDSAVAPDVREIRSAGLRAASLTDHLLTFSRQQGSSPVALDLARLLRAMEPSIREGVGEAIDVSIDVAPGAARVLADPAQMERMITHLVDNARVAMPEGGRLSLAVRDRSDDLVALTVTDTGVGMSPDVVGHIFDPFFTTRAPGDGAGLGLALVHGIVEERGGRIEVRSAPGEGTSMTVLLPRLESTPSEADDAVGESFRSPVDEPALDPFDADRRPPPLPELPASPWTPKADDATTLLPADILLVEDDGSVLRLGARILEREGYRVRTAGTGGEAVSRLTSGGGVPDLVVADARLRDLDAATLVSAVRTVSPSVPILLLSAWDPRDERVPRGAGLSVLQKPFNSDELSAAVRRAIRTARS